MGRGGGEMEAGRQAEDGVAGALWSSVGEKEDCWGLGSVLFEGGEEAFSCRSSGSQEQLVSALNSALTSSGHTDCLRLNREASIRKDYTKLLISKCVLCNLSKLMMGKNRSPKEI